MIQPASWQAPGAHILTDMQSLDRQREALCPRQLRLGYRRCSSRPFQKRYTATDDYHPPPRPPHLYCRHHHLLHLNSDGHPDRQLSSRADKYIIRAMIRHRRHQRRHHPQRPRPRHQHRQHHRHHHHQQIPAAKNPPGASSTSMVTSGRIPSTLPSSASMSSRIASLASTST